MVDLHSPDTCLLGLSDLCGATSRGYHCETLSQLPPRQRAIVKAVQQICNDSFHSPSNVDSIRSEHACHRLFRELVQLAIDTAPVESRANCTVTKSPIQSRP